MKYLKLFALSFGVLALAACSDKDEKPEYNTNPDVTVEMSQTDITFDETEDIVTVPFTVKGETNGYVVVTCTVAEYGPEAAMSNVHYYLTSNTVTVEPGTAEGYFEVRLVDDFQPSETRQFSMTITQAEGAKPDGVLQTIVSITDNDSDPYRRLGGTWYMHTANGVSSVAFKAFPEGTLNYAKKYMVSGLFDDVVVPIYYNYDPASDTGSVVFNYGEELDNIEDPSYGMSDMSALIWLDGGYIQMTGKAEYAWTEDRMELYCTGSPMADDSADLLWLLHFDVGYLLGGRVEGVTKFTREW